VGEDPHATLRMTDIIFVGETWNFWQGKLVLAFVVKFVAKTSGYMI
jgi:hypothetical protein